MKLKQISKSSQVICGTHFAQIASAADTHMFISKHEENGRTETRVRVLEESEKVDEIARIIGGIDITDAVRAAAYEMIEEAKIF